MAGLMSFREHEASIEKLAFKVKEKLTLSRDFLYLVISRCLLCFVRTKKIPHCAGLVGVAFGLLCADLFSIFVQALDVRPTATKIPVVGSTSDDGQAIELKRNRAIQVDRDVAGVVCGG
ncbi:hypothetical protein [Pandoraea iniqua]|uniref:hypothetical protein n=1 Tax=Pandoraea iniqua TaxID=2508288 RepID=UPI00124298E8|nr:hypothetical protein [Pandoraea iniqua]